MVPHDARSACTPDLQLNPWVPLPYRHCRPPLLLTAHRGMHVHGVSDRCLLQLTNSGVSWLSQGLGFARYIVSSTPLQPLHVCCVSEGTHETSWLESILVCLAHAPQCLLSVWLVPSSCLLDTIYVGCRLVR